MRRAALVAIILAAIAAPSAQPGVDHWVGTWSTAVVPSTVLPPVQGFRNPPPIASQGFQNQTLREIVHASIGGDRVRVVLSNVFGSTPLRIGAASIALAATRDRAHPLQILPAWHAGDHLHPNDAGYNAMANAIDLKLFSK